MPSYYTPEFIPESKTYRLRGEEFHHLSHVKRIAVGDVVKLNNGNGVLAEGKIQELTKHYAEIEVLRTIEAEAPKSPFAIAFALLKNKHDELLVEKCTELGATAFYPLHTEYGVRNPSANTIQRFRRIALAAIKQCDNPYLPLIAEGAELNMALQGIIAAGWQPVVCSERRPDMKVSSLQLQASPCFMIGPEGGWKDTEFALFSQLNLPELCISPLILRAETAAIAVAAQYISLSF